jgi:hypothetical protein
MSEHKSPFSVRDNRMFNPDGSLRADHETPAPASAPKSAAAPQEPQKTKTASTRSPEDTLASQAYAKSAEAQNNYPAVDFPTFILSLASSVQISLGIISNPITGKSDCDLDHAKQTIDILGMLEQKTEGNLSPEESGLLKKILFQLRMQFVELNKSQK